jgi:hypothetical protein
MPGFEPYKIDRGVQSKPSEGGLAHVPEGWYLAEVVTVEVPGDDNYYRWILRLTDGPPGGLGVTVPYFVTMRNPAPGKSASSQFKLGNFLSSASAPQELVVALIDMEVPDPETHQRLGQHLLTVVQGKAVCVHVGDANVNGRIASNIDLVFPPGDFPIRYHPLAGAPPASNGGPPSANAVGIEGAQDATLNDRLDALFHGVGEQAG